jgi:predicted ferric reductase
VAAFAFGLLIPIGLAALVFLVAALRPAWLGVLPASFTGPEPHGYWFLSRASGIAAYVLLWISTVIGIGITSRLTRVWPGGPAAIDLHEFASLLGLGLLGVHVAVLLGDRFIVYSPLSLFVPFVGAYRPLEVALGQVAFWLLLPVTFTFYLRRWIGYRTFKVIHYASFLVFALALAHGVTSGSDTGLVAPVYWLTGLSVVALTVARILRARSKGRPAPVERPVAATVAASFDPRQPLWSRRQG